MRKSEVEKIKLEAQFRNGIAISVGFSGTFGLLLGIGLGGSLPFPVVYLLLVMTGFWFASWLLHLGAARVLDRLDSDSK